jgi:hypothetical protein
MPDINGWTIIISSIATILSVLLTDRQSKKFMAEKIDENKKDLLEKIHTEKSHAMTLASQKFSVVEEDIREIFPRLKHAEEGSQKNCIMLTQHMKRCSEIQLGKLQITDKNNGGIQHG